MTDSPATPKDFFLGFHSFIQQPMKYPNPPRMAITLSIHSKDRGGFKNHILKALSSSCELDMCPFSIKERGFVSESGLLTPLVPLQVATESYSVSLDLLK